MNDPGNDAVDNVLQALREAQPVSGLEERLVQRLGKRSLHPERFGWMRWLAPGALAAFIVCGVLLRQHGGTATAPVLTTRMAQAMGMTHAEEHRKPSASPLPVRLGAQSRSGLLRALSAKQRRIAEPTEALGTSEKREASYPAPELPLTEQERLLLKIAHRNDPVLVAALDPVLRDQALARDRVESEKFFAPRPLPKDLQQEIDAAVRAQYDLPSITNR